MTRGDRSKRHRMPMRARCPTTGSGGEGVIDDNSNNQLIDGRVWGPRQADTRDGQRWSSQPDGCNNNEDKEGGLHPTPRTTVTQELAVRLRSVVSRMHRRPPCPTWMTRTDDDDNDNERWTTQ